MSISYVEDVKTVEDLEQSARDLVDQARATGRPIVIAEAGKPAVVLVDAAKFERLVKAVNLARLLGEAEEDVRAGRTQPAEEVFRELEQEYGYALSNRNRGSRQSRSS